MCLVLMVIIGLALVGIITEVQLNSRTATQEEIDANEQH